MPKTSLTIRVDLEAARAYEATPAAAREALDRLLSDQLMIHASGPAPAPEVPAGSSSGEETATLPIDREERLRRLRAACGIWEGRTDLPTRDALRDDWEGRLQRLGLGG